jgi:hypothetical protein
MKIRPFIKILAITFMLMLPVLTPAQDPNAPPPPDPDPGTPIDGGLTLLLAAGAAYGVKKYRNNRKKNEGGDNDLK